MAKRRLSGLLVTILMAWAPVTLGALMTGGAAAMLSHGPWSMETMLGSSATLIANLADDGR